MQKQHSNKQCMLKDFNLFQFLTFNNHSACGQPQESPLQSLSNVALFTNRNRAGHMPCSVLINKLLFLNLLPGKFFFKVWCRRQDILLFCTVLHYNHILRQSTSVFVHHRCPIFRQRLLLQFGQSVAED